MVNTHRKEAISYVKRWIGTWYKWGGDDSSGFDCSGLVIEMLKSAGILPRKFDTTAAGLHDMFKHNAVNKPYKGCLVFWHNGNGKIIHVEIMINEDLALGASGGGSKTLTAQDAIRHNAFIKVRPYKSRKNVVGFVDPFL